MSVKGSSTIELRRVTRDAYGDRTPTATLVTFKKCVVIPRTLGEDNDRGAITLKGHQVFVPPQSPEWDTSVVLEDQEIKDTDQLLVRGEWTDIEGVPAAYENLKGKWVGTMVTTRGEVVA